VAGGGGTAVSAWPSSPAPAGAGARDDGGGEVAAGAVAGRREGEPARFVASAAHPRRSPFRVDSARPVLRVRIGGSAAVACSRVSTAASLRAAGGGASPASALISGAEIAARRLASALATTAEAR